MDVRSAALSVLAILATIVVLRYAQEILIPIVLSILASYALAPLVARLELWRLPRLIAVVLVLAGVTTGLGSLAYGVRLQAVALVEQMPEAARRLRRDLRGWTRASAPLEQVQRAATELQRAAEETTPTRGAANVQRVRIEETPFDVRGYLWWGSMGLLAAAGQVVLILFLVFFLLLSGDLFKRKLVAIAGPQFARRHVTVQILDEINVQIERFLFVRLATSAIVGVGTWLALTGIGLQQSAIWGITAAVFNVIPYFGPLIVSAGLFVVAYLQFGAVGMAVYAAGVAAVITSVEGWLIEPALFGRAARMNEVAVFVGLIFWSWVWGFWGMILAVPLMMTFKAVCDHIEDLRPVSELLGE